MWCWVCVQDVLALGEDLQQRDDHELPQLLAPDQHHNHTQHHLTTNAPKPRTGRREMRDVMRMWCAHGHDAEASEGVLEAGPGSALLVREGLRHELQEVAAVERGEARAQPVGVARVPADRHDKLAEKTHGAVSDERLGRTRGTS